MERITDTETSCLDAARAGFILAFFEHQQQCEEAATNALLSNWRLA